MSPAFAEGRCWALQSLRRKGCPSCVIVPSRLLSYAIGLLGCGALRVVLTYARTPAPYAGPGPGEVQGFLLAWKGISACPKSDFRYLCSYLPSRLPHLAVPVRRRPARLLPSRPSQPPLPRLRFS